MISTSWASYGNFLTCLASRLVHSRCLPNSGNPTEPHFSQRKRAPVTGRSRNAGGAAVDRPAMVAVGADDLEFELLAGELAEGHARGAERHDPEMGY